jgi:hypothetical protein
MHTGLCGIPLSIKGGPGHERERELLEKTGRTKERENRGVGGRHVLREEIGSRTAVKLFFREKSIETYKIYIL